MAKTKSPAAAGASPVHWLYRLILNTLEPFFAFSGAILVFRDPASYLSTMTRHAVAYPAEQGPVAAFVYTQLGGGWLYFAFVEAVVLRLYPTDTRLWRWLFLGMLLSDAAYAQGCAQALGGWATWVDVTQWTAEDWTVFWTTAPPLLARLSFVLGFGVDFNSSVTDKKRN